MYVICLEEWTHFSLIQPCWLSMVVVLRLLLSVYSEDHTRVSSLKWYSVFIFINCDMLTIGCPFYILIAMQSFKSVTPIEQAGETIKV